jgi:hypothetical protein
MPDTVPASVGLGFHRHDPDDGAAVAGDGVQRARESIAAVHELFGALFGPQHRRTHRPDLGGVNCVNPRRLFPTVC